MNDSRIRAAERWVKANRPEPLRVLAQIDGEPAPRWMNIDEMIERGGDWQFRTTGNNVRDVSRIIEYIAPGCVIN